MQTTSTRKVHFVKSGFKTPAQVRFTDLAGEMAERFKMNQNRIAAVTRLSKGQVSQILSGKRNPGAAALELLEREYRALTEPVEGETYKPNRIHDQLEYLERAHPPSFEAAKATINALHKQAVQSEVILHEKKKGKPANSELVSEAAASSKAALERLGVLGESGGSSGKPESGGPHPHKGQQSGPASGAAKPPRPGHEGKDRR